MKSKFTALALFTLTAVTVSFYPAYQSIGAVQTPAQTVPIPAAVSQEAAEIEVVFVLDTTGSMSGLIQAAKEKIWSIASTMASAQSAPRIKMGLVAYRDRGDAYVTRVLDLSDDLDSMYAALMDFSAAGGGDGPESVNQALHDAVHGMSWSQQQDTYKVVFLVGDAPAHMDYQDDVKYPETVTNAVQKGIVINAIQCGSDSLTAQGWQQIAALGNGNYFQVEQSGNAVAIATPYDKEIATLSAELDATRLYYGNEEEKEKQRIKVEAGKKLHAAASPASRARRAAFNASASGKANFIGEQELVDDITSGRIELADISSDLLPESMRTMPPEEQQALVRKTADRRDTLQQEIRVLARQRAEFIEQKIKASGGAEDSLDEKIYSTVREQAAKKGLKYEADSAAY